VSRRRRSPTFSLCSLTNVSPDRVAAALEPLRELDPEVVLAVDDRVERTWIDGYRTLADRVILISFPGFFGRVYAWLFAQCAGRWVLQLDADEVPAPNLGKEVLATVAAGDVTHVWIPRRWLYPDGGTYLAQWPWRPSYALRLLRNDPALVHFPGRMHLPIVAVGPTRYLREPIYHADLVLHDLAARRRKVARYEEGRPGLVVDGRPLNEAYYLPELRDRVRTAPVPERDAAIVARFLEAPAVRSLRWRRRARVSEASNDAIETMWSRRPLPEEAYRARLRLLDDDLHVVAGEERLFDVEVENLGSERWPGGPDAHPQIRVGCRWVAEDGTPVLDNTRTPFGAPVDPGTRVVVPVRVRGDEGMRTLEIDVVHEHVRWFGAGIRVELAVEAPAVRQAAPA
jgi:hypothetical protein